VNDGRTGWTDCGEAGEAPLDLAFLHNLSIGDHTLILEVNDGKVVSMDEMVLTIQNSPPAAKAAPLSQVLEIGVDPIEAIADVMDFDGDCVEYEWLLGGSSLENGYVTTIQGGSTVPIPDLYIPPNDAL
jgi:hypothetical protein